MDTLNELDGAETTGELVRVFNHYFSSLNIAEESFYLRLRRRQSERGGHYWSGLRFTIPCCA
jgi:phosphoenolpyruvate carboxylase